MPVPEVALHQVGLPKEAGVGLFETATYTCSHCQTVVIMNPARKRERGYCRGCDSYICDPCTEIRSKTFECKTARQIEDEILARAERQGSIIIPRGVI
jgi:hypothetical protein